MRFAVNATCFSALVLIVLTFPIFRAFRVACFVFWTILGALCVDIVAARAFESRFSFAPSSFDAFAAPSESSRDSCCEPFSFCRLAGLNDRARDLSPIWNVSVDKDCFRALGYVEPRNDAFVLSSASSVFASERVNESVFITRGADLSLLPIEPYRGRVFGYGFASLGAQDSQGNSTDNGGFDVNSYGGALGQDFSLTDYLIWGYGIQGTQTNVESKRTDSYDARLDTLAGFLRLSVFEALWHIDMLYGAARNWETQTRLNDGAQSTFASTQWFFESEFGARLDKGYTRIEPRLNLRVMSLIEPTQAEQFYASNVYQHDFSGVSYRMKVGSRFSWEYAIDYGLFKPFLSVDWLHEFGNSAIYTINEQAPAPVAYRVAKHRAPRDRMELGGGIQYALRDSFDVYIQYEVEIANSYADQLFYAGFNKKF